MVVVDETGVVEAVVGVPRGAARAAGEGVETSSGVVMKVEVCSGYG